MPGTNTLAYLALLSATKNFFITLTPGDNAFKLFFFPTESATDIGRVFGTDRSLKDSVISVGGVPPGHASVVLAGFENLTDPNALAYFVRKIEIF